MTMFPEQVAHGLDSPSDSAGCAPHPGCSRRSWSFVWAGHQAAILRAKPRIDSFETFVAAEGHHPAAASWKDGVHGPGARTLSAWQSRLGFETTPPVGVQADPGPACCCCSRRSCSCSRCCCWCSTGAEQVVCGAGKLLTLDRPHGAVVGCGRKSRSRRVIGLVGKAKKRAMHAWTWCCA